MKIKTTTIALAMIACVLLAAGFLIAVRGGLIAWVSGFAGMLLLAKLRWRPSRRDAAYAVALFGLSTLAWVGTFYYVISTYESGEVVELTIDERGVKQTVRLWVMDLPGAPVVYIDAEPELAESLLAGKPVRFTRAGITSMRVPEATLIDEMSGIEADAVLQAMADKYGSRMAAVDLYYGLLGRPRNRLALVVRLIEG